MKIKTGIIGCGVVGKKRKKCIEENPHLELCAISDITYKKIFSVKNGIEYFKYYDDIFKKDLDAIFICMPNYLAQPITITAIEKGIHVFCEKPPSKNLKELLEVKKQYIKHPNLKLKYGFNHRYHDSVSKALKIIQSKEYGKVVNIRGVYGKSKIVTISKGWRSKRKYAGGGILLDQGIHMLDMINLFVGDIVEVKSMVSNSFWNKDVEDNAFALLKSKEGKIISIHSSATQWQHKFLLEITLEKCLLILSGILSGSKSYGREKLILIPRTKSDKGSKLRKNYSFLQKDFSWNKEVDEFADSIYNDKKVKNGTLEESIKVMKLIEEIYSKDTDWYNNYVK
jgi:predicted dehydrogenase